MVAPDEVTGRYGLKSSLLPRRLLERLAWIREMIDDRREVFEDVFLYAPWQTHMRIDEEIVAFLSRQCR